MLVLHNVFYKLALIIFSQFLSADKTRKCGQYLGMRDGFIEDFQIWSPSESPNYPATAGRPGARGWRPSKYDMQTPFIQVYLFHFYGDIKIKY